MDRAAKRVQLFHPLDNRDPARAPATQCGAEGGRELPRGISWDRRRRRYRVRVKTAGGIRVRAFRELADALEALAAAG